MSRSCIMFSKALREQDLYLKVIPPPDTIKMPELQGIKQKKLSVKQQHMNSFLQEQNLEVFHVNPKTKKRKAKKTVFTIHK
jgi:hypothetical protein